MNAAEVFQWVSENKTITLVTVWPILSGLINIALRYKNVEDWVKLAETKPRTAHLIKLMRGLGLDPVKVVQALIGFIFGKAHDVSGAPKSTPPPKAPEKETEEKVEEVKISEKEETK